MDLWLLPTQAQCKALALPEFQRLCQRADPLATISPGLDSALGQAFAWSGRLPWAGWVAASAAATDRAWLLADLMHLRAEVSTVRVMGLAVDSDPDHPDLSILFEALRPWLAEESIEIVAAKGGRALLNCPRALGDPEVSAPDVVLGSDLRLLLPNNLSWQRRINELQIVLTQHACNESRQARQLPSWNSLWFWGFADGASKRQLPMPYLASNDLLLLALARHSGASVIPHQQAAAGAVLRDLRDPQQLSLLWQSGLRPRNALLRCADGSGWRLKPAHRWRFWRR